MKDKINFDMEGAIQALREGKDLRGSKGSESLILQGCGILSFAFADYSGRGCSPKAPPFEERGLCFIPPQKQHRNKQKQEAETRTAIQKGFLNARHTQLCLAE